MGVVAPGGKKNHIRTKTTTCFGLITGSSSGCTGLVRRL